MHIVFTPNSVKMQPCVGTFAGKEKKIQTGKYRNSFLVPILLCFYAWSAGKVKNFPMWDNKVDLNLNLTLKWLWKCEAEPGEPLWSVVDGNRKYAVWKKRISVWQYLFPRHVKRFSTSAAPGTAVYLGPFSAAWGCVFMCAGSGAQ